MTLTDGYMKHPVLITNNKKMRQTDVKKTNENF